MSNARNISRLPQLGAGNASLMKNRIINGAMVISQRNGTSSVTIADTGALTYTLDRMGAYGSVASKFSVQQNAGSVTPPAGFTNYLGVTSLSAYSVGSSDLFKIQQSIEGYNTADLGWGTANAKTVTLSFWVRSSLTGTFGGAFVNNAFNRNYPFSYTISAANTWEQKTVTIAGDTTGTWESTTSTGIQVIYGLGMGSTFSGTAGAWAAGNIQSATGATSVVGTSGATFYITGVQLEVGSSATGFEYVNYQTSLANCQRYYEQVTYDYGGGIGIAQAINSGRALGSLGWTVTKRSSPTLAMSGTIQVWNSNATGYTSSNVTFTDASVNNVRIDCNSVASSPLVAGYAAMIYPDVTDAILKITAEL